MPTDMKTLGQQIIEAIISGSLCHATCAHDASHGCVVIWSSGAAEQIDALVASAAGQKALQDELDITKAALAEAQQDKERLDWLEASPYRHVEGDYWDTGNPYWRCQDRKNVNTIACIGPDIRAAIDAAIAQEGRT